MFLKEVPSAHQACIYLIRNEVKTPICEILSLFKTAVLNVNIFESNVIVIKSVFSASLKFTAQSSVSHDLQKSS